MALVAADSREQEREDGENPPRKQGSPTGLGFPSVTTRAGIINGPAPVRVGPSAASTEFSAPKGPLCSYASRGRAVGCRGFEDPKCTQCNRRAELLV